MIDFNGRGILLDVEGTTSSIRFVHDVMFPFARRRAAEYLAAHWDDAATQKAVAMLAADVSRPSVGAWLAGSREENIHAVLAEVYRLMDGDVKATGLKELQGLVWQAGFASGELKSHLYDDTLPALKRWKAAGIDLRIFSSGSIAAQKLFFGHTIHGDLLPLLSGHYDTTTGPKRVAESYRTIAAAFALPPQEILFLSDIVEELDAAYEVGMKTALVVREGNAEVRECSHPRITSFEEIRLAATR